MEQLIRIMPLEPYAFGTDQKFRYPGENLTGKESYFVKACNVPEQTTILGMLRFTLLKQKGLLHSDFQYTREEEKRMAQYIGAESFQFGKKKQKFGCIHKISPVFLMDGKGSYYVKNPFHNMEQKKGYRPMTLSEETVETSFGDLRLPKKEEYHAKTGHAKGYYNLDNGEIDQELFTSVIVPGNRKNNRISDDDCFFRRELFILKKGYCFAVFADIDDFIQTDIVSMGLGGCMFLVTSEADREEDLEKRVEAAFAGSAGKNSGENVWMYALSDLVVPHQPSVTDGSKMPYKTFCIVEQKQMRNLKTKYYEKERLQKLELSKSQINMIQSGSVFFQSCGLHLDDENLKQIGYNRIVKLGGNKHASNNV